MTECELIKDTTQLLQMTFDWKNIFNLDFSFPWSKLLFSILKIFSH